MTTSSDRANTAAAQKVLTDSLAAAGLLDDPRWRQAVEAVPRERFIPGFYIRGELDDLGLPIWQPITAETDPDRWLDAVYGDETLLTQLDGQEPDWATARPRHGGTPTSSSTLPSLVLKMWQDADLQPGQDVLEVGLGTGYSTALACEFLGDEGNMTSVDVDPDCVNNAAEALTACGYQPDLAAADGLYGYWPSGPYDRIVGACSFRSIPRPWLAQTNPGGKILTTLGGWLHGYARVLLTVNDDNTAAGRLLPGTVSFMAARAQTVPRAGNPWHWSHLPMSSPRPTRLSPTFLTEGTDEAFYARFLAQSAAPQAQLILNGNDLFLLDVLTGSIAHLTQEGADWTVRTGGPAQHWDRIEETLEVWHRAGRPGPEEFKVGITRKEQRIHLPGVGALSFLLPER